MSVSLDREKVLAAAQAALSGKLGYIDKVLEAITAEGRARAALAAAQAEAKKSADAAAATVQGALDAGWTQAELKSFGIPVAKLIPSPRTSRGKAAIASS